MGMENKQLHNALVRLATIENQIKLKEGELKRSKTEADNYGSTHRVYRKDNEEPKPVKVEVFEQHQLLLQSVKTLEYELDQMVAERKTLSSNIVRVLKAMNGNILQTTYPEGNSPNEVISASLEGGEVKITVKKI